jgi:hypothetical protein
MAPPRIYRRPSDFDRQHDACLDRQHADAKLSRERAVLQLSMAGWMLKDLAHLYRVDTLDVLRAVWRQKRELRQRHRAGDSAHRLARAFGLTIEEVRRLTEG